MRRACARGLLLLFLAVPVAWAAPAGDEAYRKLLVELRPYRTPGMLPNYLLGQVKYQAMKEYAAGRPQRAETLLRYLVAEDESLVAWLLDWGRTFQGQNELEYAVVALTRVLELHDATPAGPPEVLAIALPDTLARLVELHGLLGRHEQAQAALSRLLGLLAAEADIEVLAPEILVRLARYLLTVERHADAEALLLRARTALDHSGPEVAGEGDDDSLDALLLTPQLLAELYRQTGREAQAPGVWRAALQRQPLSADAGPVAIRRWLAAHLGLIQSLAHAGDTAEAERVLQALLQQRLPVRSLEGMELLDVWQEAWPFLQRHARAGRKTEAQGLQAALLGFIGRHAGRDDALRDYFYALSTGRVPVTTGVDQPGSVHARLLAGLSAERAGQPRLAGQAYAEALTRLRAGYSGSSFYWGESVANDALRLADAHFQTRQWMAARALYQGVLQEKRLQHRQKMRALLGLARVALASERLDEAGLHTEALMALVDTRQQQTAAGRFDGRVREAALAREAVFLRLETLAQQQARHPASRDARLPEAFLAWQLAEQSGAAAALARMSARFAGGNDALAASVRERQDIGERWLALERVRLQGSGDAAGLAREAGRLEQERQRLDRQLAQRFPAYSALVAARPIPLARLQQQLRPDEALLALHEGDTGSFVLVVRRDRARLLPVDATRSDLTRTVRELRLALDPSALVTAETLPEFPLALAHAAWRQAFAGAEPLLQDVAAVYFVADGAWTGMTPAVLLPQLPAAGGTPVWLGERHALTILPSVAALPVLRALPQRKGAVAGLAGFGDPQLAPPVDGVRSSRQGVRSTRLFAAGSVAQVEAVRKLPSLPETAGELRRLAQFLPGEHRLFLGAEATETRVKQQDLSRYRVLAFATHGALAGEVQGVAEPGLILTPPSQGSTLDDGVLTASEIARLRLDADWVILSACNTAAPDGSYGAPGLSGLARAFFHAGGRSLLVSHWSVESRATAALTTRMFEILRARPQIGRAEALRRAMRALRTDTANPHWAHPMFWAPFVVVGESWPAPQAQ